MVLVPFHAVDFDAADVWLRIAAVRRALKRSIEIRAQAAVRASARGRLDTLTPREFEVMQRVSAGTLNK
jgi:FixJ family two-component response regulator